MKNMFKTFAGMVALLLLVGAASARPKADFDKFLKMMTDNVGKTAVEKTYDKVEFTNKKSGEKKKFVDFDEVDRQVFITMQTDLLSRELEDLYGKWKEELKSAEETPDDEKEASKKDVTEYLDKLFALRKKNAEQTESLLANLFKKWPDKFTQEEQDHISKSIKSYHDKSNLIKRK